MTRNKLKTTSVFLRYCVVGGIGTALHFGTVVALVEGIQANPVIASVIGFILALLVSFWLNSVWVFERPSDPWLAITRYAVVSIFGLCLNVLIMHTTTVWLRWHYILGLVAVVMIIPATNFTLNRYRSFARR